MLSSFIFIKQFIQKSTIVDNLFLTIKLTLPAVSHFCHQVVMKVKYIVTQLSIVCPFNSFTAKNFDAVRTLLLKFSIKIYLISFIFPLKLWNMCCSFFASTGSNQFYKTSLPKCLRWYLRGLMFLTSFIKVYNTYVRIKFM